MKRIALALLHIAWLGGLWFGLAPGTEAGPASPASGLLLTDQRGLFRLADGNGDGLARCDIGAYEEVPQLFLALLRR